MEDVEQTKGDMVLHVPYVDCVSLLSSLGRNRRVRVGNQAYCMFDVCVCARACACTRVCMRVSMLR